MNGLLMFLSSSNRYKKLSFVSMILWLIFMLCNANFSLGYMFPLINLILFVLVSNITRFNNNMMFNKMYSVFSILVWSILVDVVCYFVFPSMIFGQSIFAYILNGIMFNFKFVIYNALYLIMLETFAFVAKKIELRRPNLFVSLSKVSNIN